MYLHLGEKTTVLDSEVLGVFDMDTTTVMKSTRQYLTNAQKTGKVVPVSYDLPKSFVITASGEDYTVYTSPVAPATLLKRVIK